VAEANFARSRPDPALADGVDAAHALDHIVAAVERAQLVEKPFPRLELTDVFPDDVYAAMLDAMPELRDYRPMHGRSSTDGQTRVKLDLLPEYIRRLPAGKRAIWEAIGTALCSKRLQQTFIQRLEAGLSQRFGQGWQSVPMYPIPILTRDTPGYFIPPHTDTHWKGITVQLYLPRDAAASHIGTIFNDRCPDGSMTRAAMRPFVPNTGYAFAVGDQTWHSAGTVGSEVVSRDSILLTYFVDQGHLRWLRNRGKRAGNLLLNEVKQLRRV
jgi:hypothetical protein